MDEYGVVTIKIQTRGAQLSLHGRSYVLANLEGESEWTIDIGGKPRKVKLRALLYVPVPPSQRFSEVARKARERLRSKTPQIF